jgi:hypothetical protein
VVCPDLQCLLRADARPDAPLFLTENRTVQLQLAAPERLGTERVMPEDALSFCVHLLHVRVCFLIERLPSLLGLDGGIGPNAFRDGEERALTLQSQLLHCACGRLLSILPTGSALRRVSVHRCRRLERRFRMSRGEPQPPAMAPTTRNGSAAAMTSAGRRVCGGSCERSCSHAKNRTKGRRRCVT